MMPAAPLGSHHPHLRISREDVSAERRRRQGFGAQRPDRGGRRAFAQSLLAGADNVEEQFRHRPAQPAGITPHLVFRIPLARGAAVDQVIALLEQKAGLTIVSVEPDRAVVAFHDDAHLTDFRVAADRYRAGPRINRRTGEPAKTTVFDILELIEAPEMRVWSREDRVGARLAVKIGQRGERIAPDELYTVDVELWHPGSLREAEDYLGEIEGAITEERGRGQRFWDKYTGDSLVIARVSVRGSRLSMLLDTDVVAEVELPPVVEFDRAAARRTTSRDFPRPPVPPDDGPRVCILDSGITSGHPLLAANVGHEEAILTATLSPSDAHGHGTMVGGVAVFGDIRVCYDNGQFASPVTLFSARVLNDRNEFDDQRLMINQMRDAIRVFMAPPHNCRVFNLSLGSRIPAYPLDAARQTIWAHELDLLVRELKVVLVVSAGNFGDAMTGDRSAAERIRNEYPNYLLREEARLCDPATAALAVTVGSLAQRDTISRRLGAGANDIVTPIAGAHQPSPFTRSGPGLNAAIKPEFVHYGGNLVFGGFGSRRTTGHEPGSAVMSLNREYASDQFAYDVGTSYAAPRVARLAAVIHSELQEQLGVAPHPNLVRAVLASSAVVPEECCNVLRNTGDTNAVLKVCGYGLPIDDVALRSWDRRVTLIAQDRIELDHFHVYGIPIPAAFGEALGKKTVSVALAFDPPVRRRRVDYLGVHVVAQVIRGKTLDEVHSVYRRIASEDQAAEAFEPRYRLSMYPRETSRGGGPCRRTSTLQLSSKTFTRVDAAYGDTYWLVVRCERRWAPEDITHQDYAVAVTLQSDSPELYVQVRQRARVRVRARAGR